MANIRGLRSRIKGITSTQQITKAMKMVAVAKLRRTQAAMNAMRPFSAQCGQVMHTLCSSGMELTHPLLTPRAKPKRVTYVVVVGNRGLCGAYNLNLLRYFEQRAAAQSVPYDVIVVGRWQTDALLHLPLVRTFVPSVIRPLPRKAMNFRGVSGAVPCRRNRCGLSCLPALCQRADPGADGAAAAAHRGAVAEKVGGAAGSWTISLSRTGRRFSRRPSSSISAAQSMRRCWKQNLANTARELQR